MSEDGFLARWSRRKREAAAARTEDEASPRPAATPAGAVASGSPASVGPAAPPALPPVDSLTGESDFTPFMAKEVDPELKRSALKTLFRDERFNVMDGLDVYIDDYTKTTPIPPEWYGRMAQLAGLGDVPAREAAERAQAAALGTKEDAPHAIDSDGASVAPAAPALGDGLSHDTQPDDFKPVRDDDEARSRQ